MTAREASRQMERERDHALALVSQRDSLLERITQEMNRTKDDLNALRFVDLERRNVLEKLQSEKNALDNEVNQLKEQVQEKNRQFTELQALSSLARDKVIDVTAENLDLRKRYVTPLASAFLHFYTYTRVYA